MPLTYQIDHEIGTIETKGAGNVTLDEVIAHFRALAEDPALPDRLDVLLDLDEMDTLPGREQLEKVATAISRAKVEWGACAVVASRDALYGMLRVFAVLARPEFTRTRVFRDLEQAERWLASFRSTA
jgi:hypothetical protein